MGNIVFIKPSFVMKEKLLLTKYLNLKDINLSVT